MCVVFNDEERKATRKSFTVKVCCDFSYDNYARYETNVDYNVIISLPRPDHCQWNCVTCVCF